MDASVTVLLSNLQREKTRPVPAKRNRTGRDGVNFSSLRHFASNGSERTTQAQGDGAARLVVLVRRVLEREVLAARQLMGQVVHVQRDLRLARQRRQGVTGRQIELVLLVEVATGIGQTVFVQARGRERIGVVV